MPNITPSQERSMFFTRRMVATEATMKQTPGRITFFHSIYFRYCSAIMIGRAVQIA